MVKLPMTNTAIDTTAPVGRPSCATPAAAAAGGHGRAQLELLGEVHLLELALLTGSASTPKVTGSPAIGAVAETAA